MFVSGFRATPARQLRLSNVSNSSCFTSVCAFRALTLSHKTFTHLRLASKLLQNGPTTLPTANLTSKNAPFRTNNCPQSTLDSAQPTFPHAQSSQATATPRIKERRYCDGVAGDFAAGVFNPATPQVPC